MKLWQKTVPFVAQLEGTECGAASLSMLLRYYGRWVPLPEVRDRCDVGRDGASALSILKGASSYGLATKGLKIAAADLHKVPTPAILHWERNHFVVLSHLTRTGAWIVDPAVGRRHVPRAKLHASFSGVVLCMRPTASFQKGRSRPRRRSSRDGLGSIVALGARVLAPTFLAVIVSDLTGFIFPAALPFCFDYVFPASRFPWLVGLAFALVATSLVQALLTLARSRIVNGLRTALELRLATDLVMKVLRLDRSFSMRRGAASLSVTIAQVMDLREVITNALFSAFDLVLVMAYAVLLTAYDASLAAIVAVTLAVRVTIALRMRRRMIEAQTEVLLARGRVRNAVVGVLQGPEMIKALRLERTVESLVDGLRANELNARKAAQHTREKATQVSPFLDGAALGALMLAGGYKVIQGTMTFGILASFLAVELLVRRPLLSAVRSLLELTRVRPVLERIRRFALGPA